MTDESRPEEKQSADAEPVQADPSLQDTGQPEAADQDTGQDMPTIMPSVDEDAANRDSATIQGVDRPADKVVLDGDAIPGYDLLGELGRGGMGVVYKARDQKLKRIVALKMILSGSHASEDDMQRFQTEAEAVAKLQHANIVQIFEVAEHEGRPYIALEFADGGSLDQKIAGTPQNASESAQLVETLARAMQLAHDNEIIHRDLKPANILLTAEGEPKITDFGLAKLMDDDSHQTKSGAVMGTPSYMAPEQAASSSATLGPGADVYALGAILYHMLTGRPPFQAETQLDTIMQVLGEEPVAPRKLNSALPVDLETICLKCLEKDVHRRYESAEALAEDLRRFGADEPIQARPVSVITRGLKWAKRRPAVAGMVGISAVALVALVAGGLWYNAQLVEERDIATQQTKVAQQQRELAETREAEAKLAQENEAKQRARAERQKEVADRNFKLARDAVDELTTVSQDELFNLPQMEPVREALLQKAKEFYETFVAQAAGDPELMVDLSNAHERLGVILGNLGNYSAASVEFQQSRSILTQLIKEHPEGSAQLADSLARILEELGKAVEKLGKLNEAFEVYNEALAIREQLVKEHPLVPEYASDLAGLCNDLAGLCGHRGQTDQGEAMARKSVVLREQLVKDFPDVPRYASGLGLSYLTYATFLGASGKVNDTILMDRKAILLLEEFLKDHPRELHAAFILAGAYNHLGIFLSHLEKLDEGVEAQKKALAIHLRLAEDHPDVPKYATGLAGAYNNLGVTFGRLGKPNEQVEVYRKALVIRERLATSHVDVPKYAAGLAQSDANLGQTLAQLGRHSESIQLFEKSVKIYEQLVDDHAFVPKYASGLLRSRFGLGVVFVGRGDHARAAAMGEILAQMKFPDDEPILGQRSILEAALLLSMATKVVIEDESLQGTERTQLAEKLAVRSVALLRESWTAGSFKNPQNILRIKESAGFDPLRDRDDFKQFIKELEAGEQE